MNDDGQLRAAHLILDYEPLSKTFQEVDNAIKANDYRLARIDVSQPHFLAPHDLPPVDHPIPQGVPLAAQPIQQVPLGIAVAEEGLTLGLEAKIVPTNIIFIVLRKQTSMYIFNCKYIWHLSIVYLIITITICKTQLL